MSRRFSLLACLMLYAAHVTIANTAANKTGNQEQPMGELTRIFGDNASFWKITDGNGLPTQASIREIAGRPVLFNAQKEIKLQNPVSYPVASEIEIVFTIEPAAGRAAALHAEIAAEGREEKLPVVIRERQGKDSLFFDAGGIRGSYNIKCDWQRSLGWPVDFRQIVEYEMARQPGFDERWFSLRLVFRENAFQIYLNNMLIAARDENDPGVCVKDICERAERLKFDGSFPRGGRLTLTLSPGTSLMSVRARPLKNDDPLFEKVRIDSRLNAVEIDGDRLADDVLPEPGIPTTLGGIPFIFPERDRSGNSHIDLGRSWFQEGIIEGNMEPQRGPFGGRWSGPFNENPTRIQFAVPRGRYRALHLIAAAEDKPDSVPLITAQFYRSAPVGYPTIIAGRPESFTSTVPFMTVQTTEAEALPVKLADGRSIFLHRVTIPLEPGAFDAFDDLDVCYIELTKGVQLYRAYPDPTQYSVHPAGLPSSVRVFAMTLERPGVRMKLVPDAYAHVWTAPEEPGYTVNLTNITGNAREVELDFAVTAYDGTEMKSIVRKTIVPANGETDIRFRPELSRHGHHDITLTMRDGESAWIERKSLAYLHKDTRERGDWQSGRGPVFGTWNRKFVHLTPPVDKARRIYALQGLETEGPHIRFIDGEPGFDEATRKTVEKYKMVSFLAARPFDNTFWAEKLIRDERQTGKPLAEMIPELISDLKSRKFENTPYARFENLFVFAEPHFGKISGSVPPDYYGMDYEFTESEEERYRDFERAFILSARAIRENFPEIKIMFPWGSPLFPVHFLRRNPEVKELMDGVGVDIPFFERLPEMQLHQGAMHQLWVMHEEFKKAGVENPILHVIEAPCVPTYPGATSLSEQADYCVRLSLLFSAYGVDRQASGWGWEVASYWGEQHYGSGGVLNRFPILTPKPSYSARATFTRQLNRKNFGGWLETGSRSAYALWFEHYRTGEKTHVFWTVRGKRPLSIKVPPGTRARLFDLMDNETVVAEKDGAITFQIGASPCYLVGLPASEYQIVLGEPDHSDVGPATTEPEKVKPPKQWHLTTYADRLATERWPVPVLARQIANPGDGSWQQSTEPDKLYEDNHPLFIARFPGNMGIETTIAPPEQGGRALAIRMKEQDKTLNKYGIMPYYTSIVPARPVVIPGNASHIGIWVKAASDWGRVVYFLRDAKGEQWVSIGKRNDYNNDDGKMHNWSSFNFDGWRYLRFELPGNAPWDAYRRNGTTWWGYYQSGDGVADLPLQLEKIIVERRTDVVYVNSVEPADPADVLLGDIYAEYAALEDADRLAEKLSALRMPVPENVPDLGNPIKDFEASGAGEPVGNVRIEVPAQWADGTRCQVHFDPVEAAASYEIWVSDRRDGHGALRLGGDWRTPGGLIRGLRPETNFYVFVVYKDKEGRMSKPSEPLEFSLEDMFAFK